MKDLAIRNRMFILFALVLTFATACTPTTVACNTVRNAVDVALQRVWNFFPGQKPTPKPGTKPPPQDCRQRMMAPDTAVYAGWKPVVGYQQGEMQPVAGGRAGIPNWIVNCSRLPVIPLVKFPNVPNVQRLTGQQLVYVTVRCAWASYAPSPIPGASGPQGPLCRYWSTGIVYSSQQFYDAYMRASYAFGPPA